MERTGIPNIFKYGTSELTQDAYFAWLFAWLEEEYEDPDSKKLQEVGISFLKKILGKDINSSKIIGRTKVYRQKFRIDVIISLKGLNTVIIIEDKIHGKDSVEKQEKYSSKILNCYKEINGFSNIRSKEQIQHAYIKTGLVDGEDLLLKKEPVNAPIINVEIISQILNGFQINNDIFNAYKDFIDEKVSKRKNCKKLIFDESKFDKLKTHEGQQLFFNYLIDNGLQSISDNKPYLKLGTSRGKPWAELWIVTHHKPDRKFEDAVFYRLEKRKYKSEMINYLSIRQYHRYDKESYSDFHSKKIRYKKLDHLVEKQLTKFSFNNSISPLSDNPKYFGSDFGAFILRDGQINIESFADELIRFNNSILDDVQKIIFT